MSFPWAFNSLANAAIARVCEVDKLLILSDKMLIVLVGFYVKKRDANKGAFWNFMLAEGFAPVL